jgi:hypothetical protein
VEPDFGDSTEMGVLLLPFDRADEPAPRAPRARGSTRAIDTFQANLCTGLYPGIEQHGTLLLFNFFEIAHMPLPAYA